MFFALVEKGKGLIFHRPYVGRRVTKAAVVNPVNFLYVRADQNILLLKGVSDDACRRHESRRYAPAEVAAAAIVAVAVISAKSREIGVTGSGNRFHVGIILGFCVAVFYSDAKGGAGGLSFKHSAFKGYGVGLFSCGGDCAGGTAEKQLFIYIIEVNLKSRGQPVYDGADAFSVAFAVYRDAEGVSEGVSHCPTALFMCSAKSENSISLNSKRPISGT